jgi:predicted Fe-S protein YdhL (DUF1289 family)
MTMTVIVDDYCPRCDRTHKAEVTSWNELGEVLATRQLELCPNRPKEEDR